ncbi:hypothetical protein CHUAL_002715 [Chamberlinius hualienensis]
MTSIDISSTSSTISEKKSENVIHESEMIIYMTGGNPSEEFWKKLLKSRKDLIEKSLKENQDLKEELMTLKEANAKLESEYDVTLSETETVVTSVKLQENISKMEEINSELESDLMVELYGFNKLKEIYENLMTKKGE